MQNIVQFAKNLTLSENDKLFREVGLQNVDGSYTEEAMQIVVNLKAVELGYKDDEELFQKVGVRNHISSFEYAALFGAYNDKLVEIAKAKKAEDKKK